jgi:hypothetical protein
MLVEYARRLYSIMDKQQDHEDSAPARDEDAPSEFLGVIGDLGDHNANWVSLLAQHLSTEGGEGEPAAPPDDDYREDL